MCTNRMLFMKKVDIVKSERMNCVDEIRKKLKCMMRLKEGGGYYPKIEMTNMSGMDQNDNRCKMS